MDSSKQTRASREAELPPLIRSPPKETAMVFKKLHKVYQCLLKNNSLGNALSWPIPRDKIFPRSIGYFDGIGHWHLVAHAQSMLSPIIPFSGMTLIEGPSPGNCFLSAGNNKGLGLEFGVTAEYTYSSRRN